MFSKKIKLKLDSFECKDVDELLLKIIAKSEH